VSDLFERAVANLSPTTSMFKVLVYLSFRGASQPSKVSEETGISPGTVRPSLRSLLDRGYVTQGEDGSYSSSISFTDIISDLYTRFGSKK
jgi:DNA-binding IclR family transcriptional regulator